MSWGAEDAAARVGRGQREEGIEAAGRSHAGCPARPARGKHGFQGQRGRVAGLPAAGEGTWTVVGGHRAGAQELGRSDGPLPELPCLLWLTGG